MSDHSNLIAAMESYAKIGGCGSYGCELMAQACAALRARPKTLPTCGNCKHWTVHALKSMGNESHAEHCMNEACPVFERHPSPSFGCNQHWPKGGQP